MGAPYVSQATLRRAPIKCDGCDRLTPRANVSHAEGLRLCQSCALLYAVRTEMYAGRGALVTR